MAENEKLPPDNYERELTTDLDDETPDKPKGIALHTKIFIGLGVGVIGGLIANYAVGGKDPWLVWTVENFTKPIGTLFLNLLLMIVVPLVFLRSLSALRASAILENWAGSVRSRSHIRS